MQLCDQGLESRGEDDEVACIFSGIRVRDSGRHEDRRACAYLDLPIKKTEPNRSLEYMPRLIVSVVDMQKGGTASAPLMDRKRLP